jgi:outer membrane receptor for ferric coprogen and ferric-rhodotorulic acid
MAQRHKATSATPSIPRLSKTAIAVHSTVLIGIAAGLLAVHPTSVYAQAAVRQEAPVLQYNIAAGSLGSALNSFARAAGIELSADGNLIQNKVSQGLRGSYTVAEGFAQLLSGQGLQVVRGTSGIYSLRAVTGNNSEATLPDVVVMAGATTGSATEGTGSYTAAGPTNMATGLGLTLRQTPQSVTVVSRQRMEDFNLTTLTDVLEQTPGVTIDRQGDANNFMIRGEPVNMRIDGMRRMTGGWATDSHKLTSLDDLVEMDRIEVLKGSSGMMSGDGFYGGTVNMVRKRPTREFQGHVKAGAGSWSNYRAEADIGGSLNTAGTLRGRAVVAASDGKSFRDYVKNNSQTVFATLEADLTERTLLNVSVTHREREYTAPSDTSMIQAYASANRPFLGLQPRSFNIGAPWSGYKQESTTLFASLEHRFDNGWTARLKASDDAAEIPYGEAAYWWTANPLAIDVAWVRDFTTRNRTVALDLNGSFNLFGRKHDLVIGADTMRYTSQKYSGATRINNPGPDYSEGGGGIVRPDMSAISMNNDSYFSSKRQSLYVAGNLNIADPVKLIVGTRMTDYEQLDVTPFATSNNNLKKNGVITPYAGLVVDVHENVSLYGSYASIFKVQSQTDASGKTLAPEEGLTYELGAKGEFFNKRLNASIAHFWMKTDNTAQSTGQNRPDGTTIYESVSGVVRRGYELELSGEVAKGWQMQGSFVTNSSTLKRTDNPKQQFKLASTYKLPGAMEGLTVGAATRWQSKTTAGKLVQSSFWLVDLMARYQFNKQLSVSANVNNLFDKSYFAGMRDFGRVQYTWGAPRSVNVNMRYDF